MKLMMAVVLLSAAWTNAASETLKMRSGEDIQAGVSSLEGGKILLEDGRSFPREDVLEIQFAMKKAEQAPAEADPAALRRGRELFAQAEEFGKRHPGTDGLVLLDEGEAVVRDDGTWVERTRFAGKILKEVLKQSWGEAAGYFEEGRERVRIVKATVYHPDGAVFPLEPEKIKTSKPQGHALFFTEYHTVAYPLPQVDVGSIVEWEIEKETYNPFRKDFFFPRWGFQSGSPALVSRFSITVPGSRKLFYAVRNFDGPWKRQAEPRVSSDGKARTYSWELRDAPQIVEEPRMAQYWDYAPGLKAALFKDWDRIFDWLAQMYKERSDPGPELAQFTRDLIKGCSSEEEKAAAIYHYIQKEIRYVAVKMGVASGWGGYDANLTWKRRYGCCIDKALLFTAMLKAAGIYSSPALLDTNHAADHDFRVPDIWFEHAISFVKLSGRGFFLDSTGYDYRYPAFPTMDHGVKALNVFAGDIELVEAPKPEDNSSRYEYAVRLSSTGDAGVRYTARYVGAREGELRGYYKSIKESEQKRNFQNLVNEISPAGELRSFRVENLDDIAKPFSIALDFRLKDYPIRAGDLYIFKLPDFEVEFSEVSLDKRRYAMEYPTTFEKRYRYEIELPPGLAPVSLLAPAKLRGPGESFEQKCSSAGPKIVCEAALRRSVRVYPVRNYAAHKAFLEKVSRLTKDRIFLRAGGAR